MNKKVLGLVAAVIVLAVAGGAWWYLSDDAPAEVDLEAAVADVEADAEADPADAGDEPVTESPVELPGVWTVDTETGEFDFEQATGTFVGFRVDEELAGGIGAVEAVGRTDDVTGSMEIDDAGVLVAAEFAVDLTTITTDRSQRDRAVQRALDTGANPTATFVLTGPVSPAGGLFEAAAAGVSVDAPGELTVAGVTRAITVPLEARLVDRTIVVVGSVEFALSDFGVTAPTAPVVVSVADTATLEVQLLLVKS